MGSELAVREVPAMQVQSPWDRPQIELIKRTCAPNATDDELKMYLHVAKTSGLDPLRKQLHFLKHSGRVSFVADVNGLQARAAKEQDFEGMTHAVVYEKDAFLVDQARGEVAQHSHNPLANNGRILGAWAIVRRKGMTPFLAVVRFDEYTNQNNPLWKSKPAVMIDKVAKSTALRLAYPEQLGGIYDRAELDKAPVEEETKPEPRVVPAEVVEPEEPGAMDEVDQRDWRSAIDGCATIEDLLRLEPEVRALRDETQRKTVGNYFNARRRVLVAVR